MTWLQRYRLRHYLRDAAWPLPLVGVALAMGGVRLLAWLEREWGGESGYDPDTARAVLGSLSAAMFTFVVFVCSALLVAVQLASAQLTPRVIAFLFRDLVTKLSLTWFVFTFTLSVAVLGRIQEKVPLLTAEVTAYGCLASLIVFLMLLDHVIKTVRPNGALRLVAARAHQVITQVYPRPFAAAPASAAPYPAGPARTIPAARTGVILAADLKGLFALACRAGCAIELVPQVGDFVAAGDPLFRVAPAAAPLAPEALEQSVAVGDERTVEQDPAFAFRILVDIASKGLSPAINDPTTAVLAIDQIHFLLGLVGRRQLDEGRHCDAAGRLRLIYRTPDWEDFVHLAVTEIRHFGAESIQVTRRLRALLENLIETLPAARTGLLRQELQMVQRSAQRFFPEPEDRALAEVSDLQGVGGKARRPADEPPKVEATP